MEADKNQKKCFYCGAPRPYKARHCGRPECRAAFGQYLKATRGNSRKKPGRIDGEYMLCEKVRPIDMPPRQWEKHIDNLAACYAAEAEILHAAGLNPASCSSHAADRVLKNC